MFEYDRNLLDVSQHFNTTSALTRNSPWTTHGLFDETFVPKNDNDLSWLDNFCLSKDSQRKENLLEETVDFNMYLKWVYWLLYLILIKSFLIFNFDFAKRN